MADLKKRFWQDMFHRGAPKRTDKIMIGNIDTNDADYQDRSELLQTLTTDDLGEGVTNKYGSSAKTTFDALNNVDASVMKANSEYYQEAQKNKFNKNAITPGHYMRVDGTTVVSGTYHYSDFTAVIVGKQYTSSNSMRFTTYFDSNKNVVTGGSSTSITTFIVPAGVAFVILTIFQADLNVFQLEQGIVSTIYTAFELKIKQNKLAVNSSIINYDQKVTNIDTNFIENKYTYLNLFDKNSSSIDVGNYVLYSNGIHYANASYTATGKILIPVGTKFLIPTFSHQIVYFDINGLYISGVNGTTDGKYAVPSTAIYFDVTIQINTENTYMIVADVFVDRYLPYVNPYLQNVNQIVFINQIHAGILNELWLPKEICVAVGRTIEIYHSQIMWSANFKNYHFLWSGIGKSMDRKWSVTGQTADIGTYTLTLKVYSFHNELVAELTTTVKIAAATIITPFTICPIGNSFCNNKPWYDEVGVLSTSKITFVGTRGSGTYNNTHEGRSGATSPYYLGNNSYTYDTTGYAGNDGRTQNLNPFWNPVSGDVDFAYYKSNYNQNPTKLLIWLGTNGITVDPTSNATDIKTFIDKIRATGGATIPIFAVHTLFRANQNGIGIQTGSDGYIVNDSYKLKEDLKVYNLQVELLNQLQSYANLYLIPVSACHDSEYNFGAVSTPVNPRASQTELMPIEGTHPQLQGYDQIADIIYSSLIVNQ